MEKWYDSEVLPKLWTEIIQKWTYKTVPTDYPEATVDFSLAFEAEERKIVDDMEESLSTEESVIKEFIPEGNFVKKYVGVYDVTGEAGEQILLSPEKVSTSEAIAIHYNAETEAWENVENVNVVDGYVYGDVSSLSPIAVFEVRKDLSVDENVIPGVKSIIANGNPVRVLTETVTNEVEKTEEVIKKDEEGNPVKDENGNDVTETVTTTETEEVSKIFAVNLVSGTKIEIPLGTKYAIVGGFVEADAENTRVSVIGVENPNLYVYAGTVSNNDDQVYKVNNATVIVKDSKINAVTGSLYKVKTENINITIDNSDITNFLACGQSWNVSKRKDANKADCNKDSDMVVSNASFNVINGSSVALFFQGGNSGYSYTAHTEAKVIDSTVDYMLTCGSNGRVEDAKLRIENSVVNNLQTTNRGKNGSAKVEAKSGQFTNIFVAGDANDSTVDGFVESVAYDFDSEVSGTLLLGTVGKETLADNAIVKFVKYSRSANIEIADNVKEVLGDKLIIK